MQALEKSLPVHLYGTGLTKTFDLLLEEIESGETQIAWNQGKPIRLVKIAVLEVVPHPEFLENSWLYEAEQHFPDGRIRYRGIEGLSEKLHPGEEPYEGAKRALLEELQINPDEVDVLFDSIDSEEKESPSYPGLLSRYEKHCYTAYLPLHLCREEYVEQCEDGMRTIFRWR